MSTLRQPVGPHSKKVYLRRRLLVLAVLVAIIVVVVLIIVRPGSGSGEPAGAPATSASATDAASSGADSTDASAGGADAAAGAGTGSTSPGEIDTSSTAAPGEVVACAAGNILVTPVTDSQNYAAGVNPQLSFTIQNTGAEACKINAGTSQQVYTITSGDEVYWMSTDCQSNPSDTEAVLEPGVVVSSTPFGWDRTRSSVATCGDATRTAVPAAGASYHLNVSVGGIAAPDTQQFILN